MCPSICLRMDSTEACERRKRLVRALSSRRSPSKQVLRLDVRRPELAGLVACEKDDAPGFLRIAFKHNALPLDLPGRGQPADLPNPPMPYSAPIRLYIMQSKGHETQEQKRSSYSLITLPKEFPLPSHSLQPICRTLSNLPHFVEIIFAPATDPAHFLSRPATFYAGNDSGAISSTRPCLQPQYAMAATGKPKIMRSNEGGELVVAM